MKLKIKLIETEHNNSKGEAKTNICGTDGSTIIYSSIDATEENIRKAVNDELNRYVPMNYTRKIDLDKNTKDGEVSCTVTIKKISLTQETADAVDAFQKILQDTLNVLGEESKTKMERPVDKDRLEPLVIDLQKNTFFTRLTSSTKLENSEMTESELLRCELFSDLKCIRKFYSSVLPMFCKIYAKKATLGLVPKNSALLSNLDSAQKELYMWFIERFSGSLAEEIWWAGLKTDTQKKVMDEIPKKVAENQSKRLNDLRQMVKPKGDCTLSPDKAAPLLADLQQLVKKVYDKTITFDQIETDLKEWINAVPQKTWWNMLPDSRKQSITGLLSTAKTMTEEDIKTKKISEPTEQVFQRIELGYIRKLLNKLNDDVGCDILRYVILPEKLAEIENKADWLDKPLSKDASFGDVRNSVKKLRNIQNCPQVIKNCYELLSKLAWPSQELQREAKTQIMEEMPENTDTSKKSEKSKSKFQAILGNLQPLKKNAKTVQSSWIDIISKMDEIPVGVRTLTAAHNYSHKYNEQNTSLPTYEIDVYKIQTYYLFGLCQPKKKKPEGKWIYTENLINLMQDPNNKKLQDAQNVPNNVDNRGPDVDLKGVLGLPAPYVKDESGILSTLGQDEFNKLMEMVKDDMHQVKLVGSFTGQSVKDLVENLKNCPELKNAPTPDKIPKEVVAYATLMEAEGGYQRGGQTARKWLRRLMEKYQEAHKDTTNWNSVADAVFGIDPITQELKVTPQETDKFIWVAKEGLNPAKNMLDAKQTHGNHELNVWKGLLALIENRPFS